MGIQSVRHPSSSSQGISSMSLRAWRMRDLSMREIFQSSRAAYWLQSTLLSLPGISRKVIHFIFAVLVLRP
eukprot:2427019-Ditylum_brightwellii.AAC.1